jgi:hypothetical protein
MTDALSIKIFLPKGTPASLRTAEISNWSGKAIACSRQEIDELSLRDEAGRPGVYFLIGNDSDSGEPSAYVGEAEQVGKRLKQHISKDFWTQVIAFVSKDENLTKAHIRYLEGEFIALGLEVGKGIIQNSQSSGSRLPEADQAEMDIFKLKILQLLPILGTGLFTMSLTTARKLEDPLVCKIKGLIAYGNRTENGFIVYKGSQAVLAHRASSIRHAKRRELLADKGVLVQEGDYYIFAKDHEFTSPSLAAATICGGSSNGLGKWKDSSGRSLKQIEAE